MLPVIPVSPCPPLTRSDRLSDILCWNCTKAAREVQGCVFVSGERRTQNTWCMLPGRCCEGEAAYLNTGRCGTCDEQSDFPGFSYITSTSLNSYAIQYILRWNKNHQYNEELCVLFVYKNLVFIDLGNLWENLITNHESNFNCSQLIVHGNMREESASERNHKTLPSQSSWLFASSSSIQFSRRFLVSSCKCLPNLSFKLIIWKGVICNFNDKQILKKNSVTGNRTQATWVRARFVRFVSKVPFLQCDFSSVEKDK